LIVGRVGLISRNTKGNPIVHNSMPQVKNIHEHLPGCQYLAPLAQ